MNNLNLKNSMAKKTVFTGVINGEKFDNVAAYNARMNELLSQGVENISAASSTEVRNVDENVATSDYVSTCTADQCPGTFTSTSDDLLDDEDVSFFPYMEEGDPYYLDLLVTNDPEINYDAIVEAKKVLNTSWNAISAALDDPTVQNTDREEYLSDVRDVIENLKNDKRYNNEAYGKLDAKKLKLQQQLDEYAEKISNEIKAIEADQNLLSDASDVIDLFTDFYMGVENHTLTSITENRPAKCNCTKHDNHCDCDETCTCAEQVNTECKEIEPQLEIRNLSDIMDAIFGGNTFRKLF